MNKLFAITALMTLANFTLTSQQDDRKDYIDRTYGSCKTDTPSPPKTPPTSPKSK